MSVQSSKDNLGCLYLSEGFIDSGPLPYNCNFFNNSSSSTLRQSPLKGAFILQTLCFRSSLFEIHNASDRVYCQYLTCVDNRFFSSSSLLEGIFM